MTDNDWRRDLDRVLGEPPRPPHDEYARILRRMQKPPRDKVTDTIGSLVLCLASLALAILVSLYVRPQLTTDDPETAEGEELSAEVTDTADDSLASFESLLEEL